MYNRDEYITSSSPIEKELTKLFERSASITILDIGGCEGEESIRYAKLFPNSAIYVFEPLPKNQDRIASNLKKYNTSNIELIPLALSDKKSIQNFHVSSGEPEGKEPESDWDFGNKSSSLLPPEKHKELVPWVKFDEIIKVQVDTLSNFLEERQIEMIDFVHMDVQGAELKALMGAKGAIFNIKAIWLEVSNVELYRDQPTKPEVEHFMKTHGFYLIKSHFENEIGDQMYLNKRFFKTLSFLSFSKHFKTR